MPVHCKAQYLSAARCSAVRRSATWSSPACHFACYCAAWVWLRAEKLNGARIKTLVQKLGKETIAVAKKAQGKNAEKIQPLGEALSHAGGSTGK